MHQPRSFLNWSPVVLVLLLVLLLFFEVSAVRQSESIGREVNFAGRQRMLLERLTRQVLSPIPHADTTAQHTLKYLEQSNRALLEGGAIPYIGKHARTTLVRRARCPHISRALKQATRSVSQLRSFMAKHPSLSQASQQQRANWYTHSRAAIRNADRVVRAMTSHAELLNQSAMMRKAFAIFATLLLGLISLYLARKEQETLLRQQDALLVSNQLQTEFLANVSHELRTPLNAIIGYSELMSEDAELDGLTHYTTDLRKIRHAGHHLLFLINDLLDISKIEAGKMELQMDVIDGQEFLGEALSIVRDKASHADIELKADIAPHIKTFVADSHRLRQILYNLLSNAVKFTEQGSVTLSATQSDNKIEIAVSDTGEGIPEHAQQSIFAPFTQANRMISRTHGGTGLGLALVKRLVELHGGHIVLESQMGRGSTFRVILPLRDPSTITRSWDNLPAATEENGAPEA